MGFSSEGATWILTPVPAGARNLNERKATVQLLAQVKKGDRLDASVKVSGLHSPLKSFRCPSGSGATAEDHQRE